jgi:hypothetical protein
VIDDPCENPTPEQLGERLIEICRFREEYRAAMTPAERDEQLQIYLAQAVGAAGRLRATFELCELAIPMRRQRHANSAQPVGEESARDRGPERAG